MCISTSEATESNRKEIQFANDATLTSHFKETLKRLDNRFAMAWKDFGPTKFHRDGGSTERSRELKKRRRRRQREQGALANRTATRTPQNNTFNEQEQYCTCGLHFGTFLCRPLQNNNVK